VIFTIRQTLETQALDPNVRYRTYLVTILPAPSHTYIIPAENTTETPTFRRTLNGS
jgi:hypothetical protein